jgi:hypothetical protein
MDEVLVDDENEPKTRPSGVSIVAVLALISGFFSFCYTPFSVGSILLLNDARNVALRGDSVAYYYTVTGSALGWVMSIILIALGFGLWKLKEWARSGAVVFSIFSSVWTIASGGFGLIYIVPRVLRAAMAATPTPEKMPDNMLDAIVTGTVIFTGAVYLVLVGVYIAVAIYLSKPAVKDAFRPD